MWVSCEPWQGLRERTHWERGAEHTSQFGEVSLLFQGEEKDTNKKSYQIAERKPGKCDAMET